MADERGRLRHDGPGRRRRRAPDDRHRHARLRLHGQGPRERLPQARLHDVAAAAACRGSSPSPGRTEEAVAEAARRYGFEGYVTDWRELVANRDDRALRQQRAEQPPRRADDRRGRGGQARRSARSRSRALPTRATRSGSASRRPASSTCAPSTTASSRPCGSRARCSRPGELGEIYHFRGRYLQEWGDIDDAGLAVRPLARRLGRARRPRRARDRPRALPRRRDRARSAGTTRTFKAGRDVDDAFEAAVEFENGAVGTLEASRFCPGRKNAFTWEINGSKGSIAFDLERLNELQVHLRRLDARRARSGLPQRARLRGRPPLLGALVAPRPHHRLGAHVRARAAPPPDGDRATTATWRRTGRRSRTATAPPRCATRSCARPRPGSA